MVLSGIIQVISFISSIPKLNAGSKNVCQVKILNPSLRSLLSIMAIAGSIFHFKKNIHQLPQPEFTQCLADLYFRQEDFPNQEPANFKEMLYSRLGKGISDKFLVPYNEKLYACDLSELDVNAMGRFFPHADTADIIRNMRTPDNKSYNSTFTYPEGGAIEYVNAPLYTICRKNSYPSTQPSLDLI